MFQPKFSAAVLHVFHPKNETFGAILTRWRNSLKIWLFYEKFGFLTCFVVFFRDNELK